MVKIYAKWLITSDRIELQRSHRYIVKKLPKVKTQKHIVKMIYYGSYIDCFANLGFFKL